MNHLIINVQTKTLADPDERRDIKNEAQELLAEFANDQTELNRQLHRLATSTFVLQAEVLESNIDQLPRELCP